MSQPILNERAIRAVAERRIQQAMDEGAFDNLPGAGKPIPDLDGHYDEMWWIKKWIRREQIDALPKAFALQREIDRTLKRIAALADEEEVRAKLTSLKERLRLLRDAHPFLDVTDIDVDDRVRRWRWQRKAARQTG